MKIVSLKYKKLNSTNRLNFFIAFHNLVTARNPVLMKPQQQIVERKSGLGVKLR